MIILNMREGGAEPAETDNPVVVMRRDYIPDSAGPGKFRSGAASIADSLWLAPAEHRISSFHIRRPPGNGGVNGGGAGTLAGGWLWDSAAGSVAATPSFLPVTMADRMYREATPLMGVLDSESKELDPNGGTYHFMLASTTASANSMLRFVCNGAGGWGDALERDPHQVLIDVRDEYVTTGGAARDYGVVVLGDPVRDPEGLRIDEEATERLRAERRACR
jgi:N-methylhydantoinase B